MSDEEAPEPEYSGDDDIAPTQNNGSSAQLELNEGLAQPKKIIEPLPRSENKMGGVAPAVGAYNSALSETGNVLVGAYNKGVSTYGLAFPFLFVLLAGAAALTFAGRHVETILIALMLGYAIVNLEAVEKKGLVHEFADSVYYLGFIFTIASLLFSLDPFGLGDGKGFDATHVTRNFGRALLTTLVGVCGRILIRLYQRTPEESLEKMSLDLRNLTAQFIESIEHLHKKSVAIMAQPLDELDAALKEDTLAIKNSLKNLNNHFATLAKKSEKIDIDPTALKSAFEKINEVAEKSGVVIAKNVESALSAQQELLRSVEQLSKTTATISQAVDVQMTSISGSMTKAAKFLSAENEHLGKSTKGLSDEIEPLRANIGKVSGTMDALATALSQLTDNRETLDKLSSGIKQMESKLSIEAKELVADGLGFKNVRTSVALAGEKAVKVVAALDEIVDAARDKVEQIK